MKIDMRYISKECRLVISLGILCALTELLFAYLSTGIEKLSFEIMTTTTLLLVTMVIMHDSIILHMEEYVQNILSMKE